MKRIAELVVRIADLVEAEGRTLRAATRDEAVRLRRAMAEVGTGLVFLMSATPLLVGGAGLLAAALVLALREPMGLPSAVGVAGCVLLAAGGGCLWVYQRQLNR